jgi:hypothetical protein
MDKFEKLIFIIALEANLMFNPARIFAQQYGPCDTANLNYCSECRDESKRDFAKCGERDYTIYAIAVVEGDSGLGYPDYDSINDKVVFSGAIGSASGTHFEIFVMEKGERPKRVTWDSDANKGSFMVHWVNNRNNRKIEFGQSDLSYSPATAKYYTINEDGTGRTEIGKNAKDDKEFNRLYKETHDTNECHPIRLTK